jgi:hypothetical protein
LERQDVSLTGGAVLKFRKNFSSSTSWQFLRAGKAGLTSMFLRKPRIGEAKDFLLD